ncbi:MAG: efflux RND transporter periplasmic adaptor subunit, partial [Anaerolineae bacterium]|nr:efflux RND transporter periplasmic adaptor subunit [Anaerolineae bacterium]
EKELARLAIDQAKNSLYGAQGSRDAIKGSPVTSPGQRDQAEAQVLNAEIAVKIAELQYAQLFEEPKAGAIVAAEAQIAQSESTLERLRARPEPEDIALARAQVAQARVNVQVAQQRLDDVELRAPIAGRLTRWDLHLGDVVSPASPVGTLVDTSRYHVSVSIDETDIGQIAVGQEAEIRVDAFPDVPLVGQVRDISLIGNNGQGIVAYDVRVDLEPTDLAIRPLMTVGVDIIVERKSEVLLVSNRAIRRDQEGKYVEVLIDNVPERVPITTGLTDGSNTEVLEGLELGQEVIVGRPREGIFGMGG